jgi:hypothetical protein
MEFVKNSTWAESKYPIDTKMIMRAGQRVMQGKFELHTVNPHTKKINVSFVWRDLPTA